MPTPPRRPTIRAAAATVGLVAATAAAHGQTVCGAWEPLVADLLGGIGSVETRAQDLIVFDAGDGPMLYLAGNFEVVVDPVFGEVRAPGLARWDGQRWSAVPGLDGPGLELDGRATTLEVFDDGSGPALYVGGVFTTAGGQDATSIARWDGVAWSGMDGPGVPGGLTWIFDIHVHDFGDGPMLYAGGLATRASEPGLATVWRYDGAAWAELGDERPAGGEVYALASSDGSLFAGGPFGLLGDEPAPGIARFDGATWTTPLGPGQTVFSSRFWPLLTTGPGGREALIAAGTFLVTEGDETIATQLAAWDGERWNSLADTPISINWTPTCMAAFDDGSGPALFVAGAGIAPGSNIARVQDRRLAAVSPLAVDVVYELFVYDDGTGPVLLAGGESRRGGATATFLGRWRPGAFCPADLDGDCVLDVMDFLTFQNRFDRGDPRADFDGDGSLTIFDFLAFQNAFDAGCP
ncbi:MAG: GC-type dockerin domain-anchored protein [Phycisphaerales bacterium]